MQTHWLKTVIFPCNSWLQSHQNLWDLNPGCFITFPRCLPEKEARFLASFCLWSWRRLGCRRGLRRLTSVERCRRRAFSNRLRAAFAATLAGDRRGARRGELGAVLLCGDSCPPLCTGKRVRFSGLRPLALRREGSCRVPRAAAAATAPCRGCPLGRRRRKAAYTDMLGCSMRRFSRGLLSRPRLELPSPGAEKHGGGASSQLSSMPLGVLGSLWELLPSENSAANARPSGKEKSSSSSLHSGQSGAGGEPTRLGRIQLSSSVRGPLRPLRAWTVGHSVFLASIEQAEEVAGGGSNQLSTKEISSVGAASNELSPQALPVAPGKFTCSGSVGWQFLESSASREVSAGCVGVPSSELLALEEVGCWWGGLKLSLSTSSVRASRVILPFTSVRSMIIQPSSPSDSVSEDARLDWGAGFSSSGNKNPLSLWNMAGPFTSEGGMCPPRCGRL